MSTSAKLAPALLFCLAFSGAVAVGARPQAPAGRGSRTAERAQANSLPLARIIWLEAASDAPQERGKLPVFRPIASSDGRLKDFERWIDTEAARFARRLIFRASRRYGSDPAFRDPVLPIVIRKGGNNAAYGLSIQGAHGVEDHPKLPYIILDPSPEFLGDTLLHESGHILHRLAAHGQRDGAAWSAFPHTTFATSDPITALAEGYAIHFETMNGQFGSNPDRQAYYRRLAPSFEAGKGRKSEFFSPIDDLMNFAQVWSRYQGVRDGMPAFEGHVYPGGYARTQMDPARDRARLKSPNAMLASEGVAASVLFWISSVLASEQGARPAGGLDQPALVEAETTLLDALAAAPPPDGSAFKPDLLDVIDALARANTHVRDVAIACFVDVTRGVTARPSVRRRWEALYDAAIMLDVDGAKKLIAEMDAERGEIVTAARRDPLSLRAGVGPVIPVEVSTVTFALKALGDVMSVEFDLNAMSAPEFALLPAVSSEARGRVERERDRAPFASVDDFTARTGVALEAAGLAEVKRRR